MIERLRLRQTVINPYYDGIFIELFKLNYFSWLTKDYSKNINFEYYGIHSGDKLASKALSSSDINSRVVSDADTLSFILANGHYVITNKKITNIKNLANVIYTKFGDKWNRIFELLVEENYNPIHNYNMTEVITRNLANGRTRKQKTKVTTSLGTSSYTYGYNSTVETPTDKVASNNTVSGNLDDNQIVDTSSDTGTITTTKSGNIGVTTTQKMLVDELDIRLKYLFNDIIFNDVDSILCLSVY